MTWPDYVGRSIGAGKVIIESPVSDGTFADEIMNLSLTDKGFLESGLRLMPLIPDEWKAGKGSGAGQPEALEAGVLAMKYSEVQDGVPELLIITKSGVFRFDPSLRADGTSNPGLDQQFSWSGDNTKTSVVPAGFVRYPPQMESVGNRVYFTFCDGASAWVWDGSRIRPFGFSQRPAPPDVEGPARSGSRPNGAGFSVHGRIGTLESGFADDEAVMVGGVDSGRYRYKVAFEGPDGAISASSYVGGEANIRLATGSSDDATKYETLSRRFLVKNLAIGPAGTVARYVLRTRNLFRLPPGDFGDFFISYRIPNNRAIEWIDDTPDGELVEPWEERRTVDPFYFLKFFSGSLFRMRSDANPSRIWWSEQTGMFGPIPESSMRSHWRDVYPDTGAITGGIVAPYSSANVGSMLLIFKENATHYVSGDYPSWSFGTLHASVGCAGPNLVQSVPDGSIIWYGSGSFWRCTSDGKVEDIGGTIRKKLRKVNRPLARMGSSWVDRTYGEVIYSLPVEDEELPGMQFVYDYRLGGWRRKKSLSVRCAEIAGASGMVLVGGKRGDQESIWVLNRGYDGYSVTQPMAEYTTGWCSYSEIGPKMHGTTRTADIVLTMEERGSGSATVKTYTEWNADTSTTSESVLCSHPEDTEIAYYGTISGSSAEYNTSLYRERRPFSQRLATDIVSSSVFKVHLESDKAMAIANIDVYGANLSGPASRSPGSDVEG